MVLISSVCFQSQRSWKITQSDQRIWMNHSVVCGPLAPERVTAWLDFPLSGAILCNVTDTSPKQHCHRLLSGSIFSYWHFPVGEEQGAYQKHETSEGILQSARKAGKKWCFVTLTEIRSGLALQGIYCNIISIQVALHIKLLDPQLQQQFINYAQTLNMQAYLMGTLCQFSWLVCLCIHIRV